MKVLKNDYVKTSLGNFESIVVSPISNTQKPLIKNNGDMRIWYTNDENRYPVKIEIKINYGKLILLLNNIIDPHHNSFYFFPSMQSRRYRLQVWH